MEIRLTQKVQLGDNYSYAVKWNGKTSLELESDDSIHINEILYVLGLKKNLVSISFLEDKGYRVAFVDGKVLVWSKGSSIDFARVIWVCEGRLYRLLKKYSQALVHNDINPCEHRQRRYGHIHYTSCPTIKKIILGVINLQEEHEWICKWCALGNNIKKHFPRNRSRSKEVLDLIHFDVCGPMPVKSIRGSLY